MDLTFVELFAGVGLIGAAFRQLGWKCVMANDIDPVKKEMWVRNGGDSEVFHLGNCEKLLPSDFPKSCLWTASFPCIDFSEAGCGAGFQGSHASPMMKLLDCLGHMPVARKPQCILIENVPGLAKRKKGANLIALTEALRRVGYDSTDARILDAAHFTAQSRKRLFLVAFSSNSNMAAHKQLSHVSIDEKTRPPWLSAILHASLAKVLDLHLPSLPEPDSIGKLLKDVVHMEIPWYDDAKRDTALSKFAPGHLAYVERTKNDYKVFSFTEHTRGSKVVFEVARNGKSSCLRSHRGGGAMIRLLFPSADGKSTGHRIRNMSPQECAALQGVPEFSFGHVSNCKKYRAMGDAVCLPVVLFVAKHMVTPHIQKHSISTTIQQ